MTSFGGQFIRRLVRQKILINNVRTHTCVQCGQTKQICLFHLLSVISDGNLLWILMLSMQLGLN